MRSEEALTLVDKLLQTANQGKKLNNVQSVVFLETWTGRSYREIAQQLGYEHDYIKQVGSQLWRSLSQAVGEPVSKQNIQAVLRRYKQPQQYATDSILGTQSWGEAIDVSHFYNRQAELQTLERWILEERCRLIGIFGLGGIGKTALSVKLAQQVQSEFDCVIWRSLRQSPLLTLILRDILPILVGLEGKADGSLGVLMQQLRQKRCLLVLDNVESILAGGNRCGQYQLGYEDYRQLLERIGDEFHQSCLILTGREKPGGFSMREGRYLPVRSLYLQGLPVAEGEQILIAKGLDATKPQCQSLVKYFHGNPLALKIAATTIQTLFGGNIQAFLAQGSTVFSNLWDLLAQQFERLSLLQQQVMYWLAINREGVTPAKLQAELLPSVSLRELLEALESLEERSLIEDERSLIEAGAGNLTQQPVIMEYVTERLIQTVEQEIIHGELNLLRTHALMEAHTQDYLRSAQIQLILHPLTERLLTYFKTRSQLETHLYDIIATLRKQPAIQIGYAGGNLLNLFCHLKTNLKGFDFSHLAIRQAYLANAVLHNTDFTHAQFSQTVFAESFGGVLSVAFSPDGERLATSDTQGGIQVWDTRTGELLLRCQGHQRWTWAIAYSPDGRYFASSGDDYLVKLWDVETKRCLQTYKGHTYSVNGVAFSPDGKILASCSQDLTIRLWEVVPKSENVQIQALIGHSGRVWAIAFSPDGQILASGGEDRTIRLWDVATGICRCVWQAHENWVRSLAFSPEGHFLASSSYDKTIKLWDVATQQCLKTLRGHRQAVIEIAFNPNRLGAQHLAPLLVSSSFDRTIKLWNVTTGECLRTFLGHENRVWAVAYHPNGQQLASGGDDHATKFWNIKTGCCTKTIKGHTNAVLSLALSPDNRYLASGYEDQNIRVWDIKSGTLIQTLREHTNRVWSVAFQPKSDRLLLASGSADSTIKLWDWRLGNCLQTLCGHNGWVWSIAFHPHGKQLASGSYDQTVKLWDINTGECLKTLQGHTSPVVSVAFSPDGKLLASGEFDGVIKLWDIDTGECCHNLKEHANSVWSVTFSPDGQWLLSTSFDETLKLWSVATGECLQTFAGHQGAVTVAKFSPDGEYIVSGSCDRTLKLWNIYTGRCDRTWIGHSNLISSLLVASVPVQNETAAKLALFSGSFDESIKLWDLQTATCWQTLTPPRPYEDMKIKEIQGLTDAQQATLQALGAVDG